MKNITLGQYIPLDSFFHRLDPRTKICALTCMLVAIFIPAGYIGYLILGVVIISCLLASKLTFDMVFKAMKPMIFMLVFLFVINSFVIKTGDVLFSFGTFALHVDAVTQTLYIVVRLFLMVMCTTLLTATTKPLDLTTALEDLMKPLAAVKVPTHDIAMMISLALRFIPTLLEEANRILKAQASRGVDMENGKLREKMNAMLSLIVPLFVSCFQKADDLADAMEARGYIVGAKRVRYKVLKFELVDYVVLVSANLLLVAIIVIAVVF